MKIERSSGNASTGLGPTHADTHLLKAELVAHIDSVIRQRGLKQVEAAKLLGLAQPDVSRLLRGDFREYSVERLLRILTALRRDVEIVIREPCSIRQGRLSVEAYGNRLRSEVGRAHRVDQSEGESNLITANVIYRVFMMKVATKVATAFAIQEDKKEYLVTAWHFAKSLHGVHDVEFFQHSTWSPLQVEVVGHAPSVDISVLSPSRRLTPERQLPLPAISSGLVYGQDAYFLGFPVEDGANLDYMDLYKKFGLVLENGNPLPLVKRATVSSLYGKPFLLDGHNNHGFSGGPVVFRPPGQEEFAAVVSGYLPSRERILNNEGEETDLSYIANPGIMVAHDINEAVALIKLNPIGLDVDGLQQTLTND